MRIAAYCRVSTDREEQKDSLAHQKEFFLEYAEKNGCDLVRLYADEGISGTSLKKRVEFQRLMRDAQLGLFEMVVVKDISRVARNTVDFLQSIRRLKASGINVVFITANMTSLGDSEFILTIFGAMAQEESGNLSKRVKWGKKVNAKKGRVPQRIFGYDRMDNFTLQIDPTEADVVRKIFRMYLKEGAGCRSISLALNAEGAKTKFGCEWNARGVRRVLTNPIYCGHYVNNKYEVEDFLTGRQIRLPAEQNFHHDRPDWAIVTVDEFRRAQIQIEERRGKYKTFDGHSTDSRYSTKHLFSTLIKCEHCGRSFCRRTYTYVNTREYWVCSTNSQYTARRCDNLVKIEEVELLREIRSYFSSLIRDKDRFVQGILSEVNSRRCGAQEQAGPEDVEKSRNRLLRKKSRYQEMYANDVMTMAELKEKTARIDEELAELDDSSRRLRGSTAAAQSSGNAVSSYEMEIQRFLALETAANPDLRKIVDHIGVNKDGTVRIVLKKLEDLGPCQTLPSWCR